MARAVPPQPIGPSRLSRIGRRLAGRIASSRLLRGGKELFENNARNINLPLSKMEKVRCGCWLILRDFADGRFPPRFPDLAQAHAAEMNYGHALPGFEFAEFLDAEMRKPFWGSDAFRSYIRHFERMLRLIERVTTKEHGSLLELGCGSGWMAEFLATEGYAVVGTSISPDDIAQATRRADALRVKGLNTRLDFRVGAMETVDQLLNENERFDVVYIFEALHHAYDWRSSVRSALACLKPGGWLLVRTSPMSCTR
jgi:SAM-dependent methyltransferase